MHRETQSMSRAHGCCRADWNAAVRLGDLHGVVGGAQEPARAGIGADDERAYLRHGAGCGDVTVTDGAEAQEWRGEKAGHERATFGLVALDYLPESLFGAR